MHFGENSTFNLRNKALIRKLPVIWEQLFLSLLFYKMAKIKVFQDQWSFFTFFTSVSNYSKTTKLRNWKFKPNLDNFLHSKVLTIHENELCFRYFPFEQFSLRHCKKFFKTEWSQTTSIPLLCENRCGCIFCQVLKMNKLLLNEVYNCQKEGKITFYKLLTLKNQNLLKRVPPAEINDIFRWSWYNAL